MICAATTSAPLYLPIQSPQTVRGNPSRKLSIRIGAF